MNKIITIIIVIILIVGGYLVFRNTEETPIDTESTSGTYPVGSNENDTPETPINTQSNVVDITISTGPNYSFATKNITVNKGDTVRLTLKNPAGTHDFKVDEFSAATRVLKAGEEQTITFVADRTGTFEYYCSVGNHRAMGMVGTLTVR